MSMETIFLTLIGTMLLATGTMVAGFLGFRRARQELDRHRADLEAIAPVLTELKVQMEELVLDVERLGEAQRFTAQLQVERAETLRALQQSVPRAGESR